jgi:hypothetical protein
MEKDRDTREVLKAIAGLLEHSFDAIDWNFDGLTSQEQKIIETPGRMAAIRDFTKSITKGGAI